jgi:hypothetical protein
VNKISRSVHDANNIKENEKYMWGLYIYSFSLEVKKYLLEQLANSQLTKKFSSFTECQASSLCSHNLTAGFCHKALTSAC